MDLLKMLLFMGPKKDAQAAAAGFAMDQMKTYAISAVWGAVVSFVTFILPIILVIVVVLVITDGTLDFVKLAWSFVSKLIQTGITDGIKKALEFLSTQEQSTMT